MKKDYYAIEKDNFDRTPKLTINHGSHLGSQARFAWSLLERWGMVAAKEDGEDTAGRQKLKLSTPEELVERAFEVTELSFEAFEKRGWILDLPSQEEKIDLIKDWENEKERNDK